jgi:beta-lactamase superfamily II metal-dependent hydrolase
MKFSLEALQANDGDCLLLHYGGGAGAGALILIDGGSRGIYRSVLKPRLEELRGKGRLNLRMVMVSHIDADHISGIEDLLRDLLNQQGENELPYRIETLWHNSFEKLTGNRQANIESAAVASSLGGAVVSGLTDDVAAVVASVKQGNNIRNYAVQLAIPINKGAGAPLVRAPRGKPRIVQIAPGLKFTILGPHDDELENLDASWQKSKSASADPETQAADYLNRTVPNLSSIVVLAEAEAEGTTRRMLLTGDAGGDKIMAALDATGLSDNGQFHVDLLKLQHHGSNHSVDLAFFEKITADHYVISGNGRHGIPHPDTLGWLSKARRGAVCDVYLTNREGEGLTENLDKFLAEEKECGSSIRYHFREEQALSIEVPLA